MTDASTARLDELAKEHTDAKRNEAAWREARVAVERQIAEIVGVKDEGTTSVSTDLHKVRTVGKVNRSITQKDALALRDEIDAASYQRLLTWRPSLVLKELRFLEEHQPDAAAKVRARVTSKPAKTAVTVEAID